jgi:C1q domain
METAVGVVDVKSSPVYFHVQRNSTYDIAGVTIPFQIERLNVGRGINISSGIFTAPKSGIYFFSFTGIKDSSTNWLNVRLFHNSNYISEAHGTNVAGHFTVTLCSTLNLKSGDQISRRMSGGQLYEDSGHYKFQWHVVTGRNALMIST